MPLPFTRSQDACHLRVHHSPLPQHVHHTVPSPKPAPLSVSPPQDKGTSALSGAQIKALEPDSSAPLRGYAQPPAPIPNLATSLHCGTTPSRPPAASPRTLRKLSSSSAPFHHSPHSTAGAPGETSATLPTSAQQPEPRSGSSPCNPSGPGLLCPHHPHCFHAGHTATSWSPNTPGSCGAFVPSLRAPAWLSLLSGQCSAVTVAVTVSVAPSLTTLLTGAHPAAFLFYFAP